MRERGREEERERGEGGTDTRREREADTEGERGGWVEGRERWSSLVSRLSLSFFFTLKTCACRKGAGDEARAGEGTG